VRRLRRLVQKRSLRWSEGVCVLEGPDLVNAALENGVEFEAIYVDVAEGATPSLVDLSARAATAGVRVFSLDAGVLAKVADAQTPQPVLAAVRFDQIDVESLAVTGLALVLHDLRDPGNAGTIIRSADAAGVRAVIFTGQSVDPFNPKTLRATAGSAFHLPVVVATLERTLAHFGAGGAHSFATVVRGGTNFREVDFAQPTLVAIGNEATGLDRETVALFSGAISIAMAGKSESLNAGVAASLVAFEALRQREVASPTSPPPSL
jgi:RNA methyltransferase, TrmH family